MCVGEDRERGKERMGDTARRCSLGVNIYLITHHKRGRSCGVLVPSLFCTAHMSTNAFPREFFRGWVSFGPFLIHFLFLRFWQGLILLSLSYLILWPGILLAVQVQEDSEIDDRQLKDEKDNNKKSGGTITFQEATLSFLSFIVPFFPPSTLVFFCWLVHPLSVPVFEPPPTKCFLTGRKYFLPSFLVITVI